MLMSPRYTASEVEAVGEQIHHPGGRGERDDAPRQTQRAAHGPQQQQPDRQRRHASCGKRPHTGVVARAGQNQEEHAKHRTRR